jgi:hypothetical protein
LQEDKYFELHEGTTEGSVGPLQHKKHIIPKWIYQKYETRSTNMEPPKPNSLKM